MRGVRQAAVYKPGWRFHAGESARREEGTGGHGRGGCGSYACVGRGEKRGEREGEETCLLVLEAEEEDLLHDGELGGPASEAGILVLAFEVTGVVCDLAAALEGRAGMEGRRLEGF